MSRPNSEIENEIIEKVRRGEIDLKQAYRELDDLDRRAGLKPLIIQKTHYSSKVGSFFTKIKNRLSRDNR